VELDRALLGLPLPRLAALNGPAVSDLEPMEKAEAEKKEKAAS
jgi:hypothetical protein